MFTSNCSFPKEKLVDAQLRADGRAVTRSYAQMGAQLRADGRAVTRRWARSYAQMGAQFPDYYMRTEDDFRPLNRIK